jgi:hypothetical protein
MSQVMLLYITGLNYIHLLRLRWDYECVTHLREGYRLRVFENKVLGRIFGLKRDEVMRGWRKLQNEELHNLYSSPNIMRMMKLRRVR